MMNFKEINLDKVLKYTQPTRYIVESTDYDDKFETPVLTAGKNFLLGHTNEKKRIYNNVPAIIFDDFTTSFHFVDFPFKVKSSALKILNTRNNQFDIKYVYYLMRGVKIDTQLHKRYWISRFSKKSIPIPYQKSEIKNPSLETQKQIAQILDNAAALRDKTQQLLTEYDQLAQSIFLDMFGDPVTNPKGLKTSEFSKVLKLRRGFDLPVNSRKKGQYPVMASNGILDYHNEYKVTGPGIITGRSGTLGKVHLINENYWPLNTSLYSEDLKGNNPIFLLYLLRNFRVERFSRGAGVPTLNRNLVHSEKIIDVEIYLQNQFAEKIALIEQQKDLAKQELQESEDLFQALLQKAFKGELV